MSVFLSDPIRTMTGEVYVGSPGCDIGVVSTIGGRMTMEDAHAVRDVCPGVMATLVCDGHETEKCAEWMSNNLLNFLPKDTLSEDPEVYAAAFHKADEQFRSMKVTRPGGSTCALALLDHTSADDNYRLVVVHVGDSRVLLCRNGELLFATSDHKPELPSEGRRIRRRGSMVSADGRVAGVLAMSRALGDFEFKQGEADKHVVINTPDVQVLEARRGDVLVVACDGLFEGGFTNEAVAETVDLIKTDALKAAMHLTYQALDEGSWDNITCCVIRVGERPAGLSTSLSRKMLIPGPYPLCRLRDSNYFFALSAFLHKAGYSINEYFETWYDEDSSDAKAFFKGRSPPKEYLKGSTSRRDWFGQYLESQMT